MRCEDSLETIEEDKEWTPPTCSSKSTTINTQNTIINSEIRNFIRLLKCDG